MEANSDADSYLRFMGQDEVYLQVTAESGSGNDRRDALKVLKILQRGRHWVLVSLLLGNVITNETLPIVLDQDVKGGWFAVLTSTILIVIFGEIIPQSVCAKHGLAIGAWSSP
jgi:metal transporter CNNM